MGDGLSLGTFTASGGGNSSNWDGTNLSIYLGGSISDADSISYIKQKVEEQAFTLSDGEISTGIHTLSGGTDIFAEGGESNDNSMTVTVRTGQIDAQKSTIHDLINNSALFSSTAGTLQAGTYTLSGGDGMVVESKLRGADGNATKIQVILDETVAGSGVNITETSDTLIIIRRSNASDAAVAAAINTSSSLFKVISAGSTAEGTHIAKDGLHSHEVYNYTTEEIANLLNTYHTDNRDTALLRDAEGAADAFFDATLTQTLEDER